MNTKETYADGEQLTGPSDEQAVPQPQAKRPFVEPTVSVPVDVLEAITFFQTGTIEATTV